MPFIVARTPQQSRRGRGPLHRQEGWMDCLRYRYRGSAADFYDCTLLLYPGICRCICPSALSLFRCHNIIHVPGSADPISLSSQASIEWRHTGATTATDQRRRSENADGRVQARPPIDHGADVNRTLALAFANPQSPALTLRRAPLHQEKLLLRHDSSRCLDTSLQ
ncbi:hypothetical protein BDN71DRAFT_1452537 [Pleurotus eryngii]|uniref:Uncharacterized protein n=1 Tax=Pleurotus eryngii TaxID=5323 RepID=A0A9P5ZS26_PLEER|nr:hypothetical protein BDN71DRAFT_1452537 [Pleurotus eryngii]